LETFAPPRRFVDHTRYSRARSDALAALDLGSIDEPIVDLISGFAALPHCFALQSCHGHFVYGPNQDPRSHEPLPIDHTGTVQYRIAYVAFCIENSDRGRALREAMSQIPKVDPSYVQFGSPDWFWERWLNSYALQVEPLAHQHRDEATLDAGEAFHIQGVRELFFERLRALLTMEASVHAPG